MGDDSDDIPLCTHAVAEGHMTPYGTGLVHGVGVGALGLFLMLFLLYIVIFDGIARRRLVVVLDGRDNEPGPK